MENRQNSECIDLSSDEEGEVIEIKSAKRANEENTNNEILKRQKMSPTVKEDTKEENGSSESDEEDSKSPPWVSTDFEAFIPRFGQEKVDLSKLPFLIHKTENEIASLEMRFMAKEKEWNQLLKTLKLKQISLTQLRRAHSVLSSNDPSSAVTTSHSSSSTTTQKLKVSGKMKPQDKIVSKPANTQQNPSANDVTDSLLKTLQKNKTRSRVNRRNEKGPPIISNETTLCSAEGCGNLATCVCADCRSEWYCSEPCQLMVWDEHSKVCQPPNTGND